MIQSLKPLGFTLVPVPSSTGRQHSQNLSILLSNLVGCRRESLLACKNFSNYKALSRLERYSQKSRFELVGPLESTGNYVLVDDIVTSGASLRECIVHLGNNQVRFAVTLMDRPLACSV
jgi:predicted amidophosphoribosyltransferase